MAEALVVGALVSGFANVVVDRLISHEFVDLVVGKKLDRNLVEKLRNAILAAKSLAADAEQKQFGHELELVREWLDSLKDALYTADDLLDRLFIKAQIRNKKRIHRPRFLDLSGRKMVTKIEEVVERIDDLEKRKDTLGLKEIPPGSSSWRPPSTSLVKGNVFGRDADQQALIKMLNDNNHHNLSVISIVGMGGVGKTTLAQWLYNNKDLMHGVDLKAWICVSENFDVVETTKNVIKGISSGVCSLDSFDLLQQDLKEKLSEKKFFIVLDDVWSEDTNKWRSFITPFQHGSKGSTILLTTQKENVGRIVQHYNSHTLKELSDDCCWSIFADNASFPESNGSSKLEEIGRKIVKRCDGLPLAAETLGCLLRSENRVEEWNKILFSDIWEFPTANCKIVPALLLSYYHLPAHLKRCFVYCSLYPKDHKLDKNELILLWMAENLLRPPKSGETLEEVGCECFDDLSSRLFFKQVENHDEKYFVMHDLIHELATFLAGVFFCRFSKEVGEKEERNIRTRHLSYTHSIPEKACSSSEIESLRTILYINDRPYIREERATLPFDILSKNKYLRVLSFGRLKIFPDSIAKKLIQLRYLDLSWTDVKVLPESLCNFCNLQTLKLQGCSKLTMLPNGMYNLVNLRHLDIRSTPLKKMPKGMGKLKQLHILSHYIVGKSKDNGIEELGGLLNLHGSLVIEKLENVVNANQARSARIIDKKHIEELLLEWSAGDDMVSNTNNDEQDILHGLQPHHVLKVLIIKRYKGKIFPDWLGDCSYSNMTRVSLLDCKKCCMLPSLGQLPCLKSLRIERFDELKSIGKEFYKNEGHQHSSPIAPPFPSLETLEFAEMSCWEEWHLPDSEAFPQLMSLLIRNCPKLKADMVNQVLMRIVSSSSDVSKVRQLNIQDGHQGWDKEMRLYGDSLSIRGFESVAEYVFKARIIHHLTSLQIHESRDSLISLSLDAFPNLENLEIRGCSNLESVLMSEPPHAALQRLTIFGCNKLEALPRDLNSLLPNLQSLDIRGCEEICRLPEGGLPPNLKKLSIGRQWRDLSWMSNLDALTHLTIQGHGSDNIRSFPEVGSLPHLPSLTNLCLDGFDHMKTLECSELLRITSLKELNIECCPELENMEGEKPHPSLLRLHISPCPLLEQLFDGPGPWAKIYRDTHRKTYITKIRTALYVQRAAVEYNKFFKPLSIGRPHSSHLEGHSDGIRTKRRLFSVLCWENIARSSINKFGPKLNSS